MKEKNRESRRVSLPGQARVGEKIRYFRKQRGWSQNELAEGVCSSSLISLLETGQGGTTVDTLAKIADKLSVPLHEIYQDVGGAECIPVVKLDLTEAYLHRSEFAMAENMLEHLSCQENLTVNEKRRLVLLQGMLRIQQHRSQEAIQILQPLIDQIELRQDEEDEMMCKLYTQLGTAFYQEHNLAEAYSSFYRAYQVARRLLVFEMPAALAAYNLGKVLNDLQKPEKAIFYLDQARSYFDSISDVAKLADAYFQSAIVTQKDFYAAQALHLYQGVEATKMVQFVKGYQAYHFAAKLDYQKAARELYEIAVGLDPLDGHEQVMTLSRAALICIDHSNIDEAKQYLQLASECMDKLSEVNLEESALYHLVKAKLHLHENRYEDCIEEAHRSSEFFEQVGMFVNSVLSLEVAAESYHRIGMYDQSFCMMKMANERFKRNGMRIFTFCSNL